ncbi:MAG: site-2 protease family protein [Hadesarchaea archaeon]|nr:site-2 protease family protein [Hadesarchaea archaeon]
MGILFWILTVIVAFWLVVLVIDRYMDLESHGIEIGSITMLWRTKKGLGIIDKISQSSKRLWKAFGILSAVAGIALMVLGFSNLTFKAFEVILQIITPTTGGGGAPAVMPLIPGWTFPVELFIPFVIGIGVVLIVHEPAHGIVARRLGLPLESTGLLLFAVIPGAFVEPDEEKLNNSPVSDRLQVYGAGSVANIIFGFLCLLLMLSLVSPLQGVFVAGVTENTPASGNLNSGMRLTQVGYASDSLIEIDNYQVFNDFMSRTSPGDNILLGTDNGEFTLTLDNHPNDNVGYIGIYSSESTNRADLMVTQFKSIFVFWRKPRISSVNPYSYDFLVPGYIIELLSMIVFLNIGIGIFNLLPLKPLDGGYITQGLVEKVSSKEFAEKAAIGMSLVTFGVIIINLLVWVL